MMLKLFSQRYLLKFTITVIAIFWGCSIYAQQILKPGFDAKEYMSLFLLFTNGRKKDSVYHINPYENFKKYYQSPEVGLKNQWSLFLRNDNVAAITIRGTVADKVSWLANFYAAMIPAQGELYLSDSNTFKYKLAADKNATVHVGWTVSLGSMAPDIVAHVKDLYQKGVKEYYIFGHSQGGAIAFLLRSYLEYLQQDHLLPEDIWFKTYCSAAPKPGNMYYAYDYEFITRGNWAYAIVNRADWVPETPYTIQRMQDMNDPNPLIKTKQLLKKQKFAIRTIGGILYGKINRKPRKAQALLTNYLGKKMYKLAVHKAMPGLKEPAYAPSSNYMRAGQPIILMPDADYNKQFIYNGKDDFIHHHFEPYYYLMGKEYLQ